jgi:hypothetical protein
MVVFRSCQRETASRKRRSDFRTLLHHPKLDLISGLKRRRGWRLRRGLLRFRPWWWWGWRHELGGELPRAVVHRVEPAGRNRPLFFECFLCLSRACLGKRSVLAENGAKQMCFPHLPTSTHLGVVWPFGTGISSVDTYRTTKPGTPMRKMRVSEPAELSRRGPEPVLADSSCILCANKYVSFQTDARLLRNA